VPALVAERSSMPFSAVAYSTPWPVANRLSRFRSALRAPSGGASVTVPALAAIFRHQHQRPQADRHPVAGVEHVQRKQRAVFSRGAALHGPALAPVFGVQDHAPVPRGPALARIGERHAGERAVHRHALRLAPPGRRRRTASPPVVAHRHQAIAGARGAQQRGRAGMGHRAAGTSRGPCWAPGPARRLARHAARQHLHQGSSQGLVHQLSSSSSCSPCLSAPGPGP
jgi:hypothetical protein